MKIFEKVARVIGVVFEPLVMALSTEEVEFFKEAVKSTLESRGVLARVRVRVANPAAAGAQATHPPQNPARPCQAELRLAVLTAIDSREREAGVYKENKSLPTLRGPGHGVAHAPAAPPY